MKIFRYALAALLLLTCSILPAANAGAAGPKVLVLHAYHKGFGWTDSIESAIEDVFATERPDVELYVEYMNLKRVPPEKAYPALAALYRSSLASNSFACILCSDDAALDFLLAYREALFPGVPVVFCGVNDYKPGRTKGQTGYTGVAETFDIPGTIEVASRLLPNATKVAVITDVTETGKINLERARLHYSQFKHLEFVELAGLNASNLALALKKLGPEYLLLVLSYYRDSEGLSFSPKESASFIRQASSRPIFTLWDFYLFPGVVGGKIVSGKHQGVTAARMALRVLSGEKADDIAVGDSPNAYVFDNPTLQEFKIPASRLPPDSLVLNQPDTFYARYRGLIWFTAVVFFLQTATIILLTRNIRTRQRAESALRESETRFRQLADAAWEGIVIHDNGVVLEANSQFYDMVGFGAEDLIGKQLIDIVLPPDSAAYVRQRLAVGDWGPYEVMGRTKAGEDIFVEIRAKHMDFHGRALRVAAIRDITSRKRAEVDREQMNSQLEQLVEERTEDLNQKTKELEIANFELQRLDELKSTFLNTVSHDLRTPLTSIMGFIKLIRREFLNNFLPTSGFDAKLEKKAERIAGNLAIIEKESERLTRLINDLLDVSRMEADQSNWNDVPLAPATLIEEAVNACSGTFLENPDLELTVDVPRDLPLLNADPDKLLQVLVNLLNNAAKFTHKGRVTISAAPGPAETLHIRIADNGPGIAHENLSRIFDKFFQSGSDTLSEKPKGTGMGLAICKLITEHYCGRVWAESQPGQGSTFVVELPTLVEED